MQFPSVLSDIDQRQGETLSLTSQVIPSNSETLPCYPAIPDRVRFLFRDLCNIMALLLIFELFGLTSRKFKNLVVIRNLTNLSSLPGKVYFELLFNPHLYLFGCGSDCYFMGYWQEVVEELLSYRKQSIISAVNNVA